MDTLGAAVGPLLAILFLSLNPSDIRSLYFWALIPGLISVFILFYVKEPKHQDKAKPFTNPFKTWANLDAGFKTYIYTWSIFSLTNSSDVFLIMKAKQTGISTQIVILLYCFYNLVYALSSPYLGKLSDTKSRKHILAFGLLIFFIVYLGFGFAFEPWHFWILFSIYGLYMAATDGVGKALAVDLVPAQLKATGIGILGTATGLCTIAASLIAGLLWDSYGPLWTFIFGAGGAIIAASLLISNPLLNRQKP
jgi:MFS family permease